jgi:hypothetical protein
MGDRAVSEVLGFILVFSLTVTTTSFVYINGISELEDRRDVERVDNAERAFDVLANNIEDIYRRDAPSRATEIKLADAQLQFGDVTTMTVTITNLGTPAPSYSRDLDPIVYSAGTGTELVYEGGSIIRTGPNGGAVMKQGPEMLFATDDSGRRLAIILYVQTRSQGTTSIGGSTAVLVRSEFVVSEMLTARKDRSGSMYDLTFNIETTPKRAPVWKRYLNDEIESVYGVSGACSVNGKTVECTFSVDRLYVTVTGINVAFN